MDHKLESFGNPSHQTLIFNKICFKTEFLFQNSYFFSHFIAKCINGLMDLALKNGNLDKCCVHVMLE